MTDAMNLSTLAFPPTTEHSLFTPSRLPRYPLEAEVPPATRDPPPPLTVTQLAGGEEPGAEGPGRNSRGYSYSNHERDRD